MLDEGESVVVGTDPKTGAVTIQITQRPTENGSNGAEMGPQSAGIRRGQPAHRALRGRERMTVTGASDGTLTITSDSRDDVLVVTGGPTQGEIEIIEVLPAQPFE